MSIVVCSWRVLQDGNQISRGTAEAKCAYMPRHSKRWYARKDVECQQVRWQEACFGVTVHHRVQQRLPARHQARQLWRLPVWIIELCHHHKSLALVACLDEGMTSAQLVQDAPCCPNVHLALVTSVGSLWSTIRACELHAPQSAVSHALQTNPWSSPLKKWQGFKHLHEQILSSHSGPRQKELIKSYARCTLVLRMQAFQPGWHMPAQLVQACGSQH
jgi:hypothetical protein